MPQLEEKMSRAIEAAKFNYLEFTGFKIQPRLALLAGAIIGYRLGLDESKRLAENLSQVAKVPFGSQDKVDRRGG